MKLDRQLFYPTMGQPNLMQRQDVVDKLVHNSRNLGIRTHMLEEAESYLLRSREQLRSAQRWSKAAPSREALHHLRNEKAMIRQRLKVETANVRILRKDVSRLEKAIGISKRKLVES